MDAGIQMIAARALRVKSKRLHWRRRLLKMAVYALMMWLLAGMVAREISIFRLQAEARYLRREIARLREQNAALMEEIRLLHTEEYIEKIAREQLGLVKEGEIPYVTVPAGKPGP